jgi:hypothetical protein
MKPGAVCVACEAFLAECVVPVGEASAAMCWLCAHHVVDHEVPVHLAVEAECDCTPEQVYPKHVIRARVLLGAPVRSGSLVDWQKVAAEHLPHIKTTTRRRTCS